ncbi:electron transfer flavoprotein-ubiquinone oxidoreductase [Acidobacteria bacterium AH-259-A15]|nr:electron transfer flavoprotein-ubiquinone oxidoreductase [Acidobacteria bacterium AH-259-A15]
MEREQLEVDVLFVGAGPASLGGALHLSRLVRKHNDAVKSGQHSGQGLGDLTLLVIEKSRGIGSHALSGAVVDPRAFDELLEGFDGETPPYDSPVEDDALYILSKTKSFRSAITPPPLRNHGYYVASLGRLVKWMAEVSEKNGIDVYPEFPAVELLFEGDSVIGVRIGDKGVDKDGNPKLNFEPGIDVLAKVTVLGEGPRGTLTLQAERRLNLNEGRHPQIYSIGVKEIWQVPRDIQPGLVYHTLGFPLGTQEFGGGFIYTMNDNLIDLGYVVGLDYENPCLDAHHLFQEFKTHPFIREILEGGKVLSYGAKIIPEGGYYSMPRFYANGLLIVGDSAGFLNAQRLKGIHLAIKSGMLAAETIFEALLKGDYSAATLKSYQDRFEKSWAKGELWRVRNFRQAFQRGFWSGMFLTGLQFLTNGRGLQDPLSTMPGHARMKKLKDYSGKPDAECETMPFDGRLTFDKLTDVYFSNTAHEEDQPCHLKILDFDICHNRCTREYGNPCQHFCPAHVYEMVEQDNKARLQVNFSNCVHCKTCDVMDPYQIIVWTPPEGGGGPDYKNM